MELTNRIIIIDEYNCLTIWRRSSLCVLASAEDLDMVAHIDTRQLEARQHLRKRHGLQGIGKEQAKELLMEREMPIC